MQSTTAIANDSEGQFYKCMVSLTFLAFTPEAFLNTLGPGVKGVCGKELQFKISESTITLCLCPFDTPEYVTINGVKPASRAIKPGFQTGGSHRLTTM